MSRVIRLVCLIQISLFACLCFYTLRYQLLHMSHAHLTGRLYFECVGIAFPLPLVFDADKVIKMLA